MKFRPILFSKPMVEAILNGTKKQTRRIIKPQPLLSKNMGFCEDGTCYGLGFNQKGTDRNYINCRAKAQVDDVFWVRETFQKGYAGLNYIYKADCDNPLYADVKWKPSIFMPKDACRIFLKVINVRIERLQSISEQDIYDEGVKISNYYVLGGKNEPVKFLPDGYFKDNYEQDSKTTAFAHWASLWSKINGLDSWNSNPWVWAYNFEKIEKPIEFMPELRKAVGG